MQFIDALLQKPTDKIPAWMMRQAGRYLPEYLATRAKMPNFMQFCKTPELACEVTLQPLKRFPLDAAIIFSDILTIPDAMGVGVNFIESQGPVIERPIRSIADVAALPTISAKDSLDYVAAAIQMTTQALPKNIPLIGFAGSPWTVATYMMEGRGSRDFSEIKKIMYSTPDVLHALLEKITVITIDYLNLQIEAGARAIQVFDSWGGVLNGTAFESFSLQYLCKIGNGVLREYNGHKIPLIFFTKGGAQWLDRLSHSGCDALGLDWTIDINVARERIQNRVALQGNLDPFILLGSKKYVRDEVRRVLDQLDGNFTGYVFNLGHGIDRRTPIENVEMLFQTLKDYR